MSNRAALAKAIGDVGFKDCAEIGVFRGQFSEVLCRMIPNIHLLCVDTWAPSRNHRNPTKLEGAFNETKAKLKGYDVTYFRMTSLQAAKIVPDDSLDFLYIDALHDQRNVSDDLEAWVPKVRKGGVVAGHDWGHQGVTTAVQAYMSAHGIEKLFTTLPAAEDWYPSWCWVNA